MFGLMAALTSCSEPPPAYDMLILNGTIVDGSGASGLEGDLAIVVTHRFTLMSTSNLLMKPESR